MKIGIVTLPLNYNYGGLLQAFALQTILEKLGNSAEIIDVPYKKFGDVPSNKYIEYPKRIVKRLLGRFNKRINFESYFYKTYPIVCEHTDKFINERLHRKLLDTRSMAKCSDYDCLIVGSDQIWRAAFVPNIEEAFLDFAKDWDVKRIAYAASLGVDEWEYSPVQTANCKTLAKKFDAVSVREKSGVKLLADNMDVTAKHVLDPTMLVKAEEYIQLLGLRTSGKRKILMSYILDMTKEKKEILDTISKEKGLEIISTNSRIEDVTPGIDLECRIQPAVEDWLQSFIDAEVIVTDSFHACVFSILFHKQFWVLGNKHRGMSRIESLLADFGLNDRMISDIEQFHAFDKAIDYKKVDEKLAQRREESLAFLKEALS